MILSRAIFLILTFSILNASAANSYEVKIELVQPEEATKSLVLKYSPSQCQIEFNGKSTNIKNETCQVLFKKYGTYLQKEKNLVDEVGHHSPFYRITVQKDGKKWSLKTDVSDYQLCDAKSNCTAASGRKLRKFISEVNSLIK